MNLNIERKAHRELEKLAREQSQTPRCSLNIADGMDRYFKDFICPYCDDGKITFPEGRKAICGRYKQ